MRNKWSEQEMIQTRRSVSSSPSSESESNDMHDTDKHQQKIPSRTSSGVSNPIVTPNQTVISNTLRTSEMVMNENLQEMVPFSIQQQPLQQSIQHTAGQLNQYNFPNENGPVSLFPPASGNLNTQIPFPSPGTAMFPPSFVNTYSSAPSSTTSQQPSKQADAIPLNNTLNSQIIYPPNMCAAAFTASSRNLAITTSMMAPSPVQSEASPITSPMPINNPTPISSVPPHVTGNNNNNNINNTKMDFNRRKYKTN